MEIDPQSGVVGSQQDPGWPSEPPSSTTAEPSPREVEALKLKSSKKYPALTEYLDSRKEFYRRFFPGGMEVKDIARDELGTWWKAAAVIIEEIEALQDFIEDTDAAAKKRAAEASAAAAKK